MSVINNMLKDLESRSSQFTPIDIASVESVVARKPRKSPAMTIPLIMVLMAAGLMFFYFQIQNNPAESLKSVEKLAQAPVPVLPLEPEVEPIVVPVNQIVGLQINESADNLSLEFSLQEKVISYLKERSENRFVYYLKNIRSEIIAPVIKDNRWIKQLSINPRDAGVDIAFRTASGILVETRQQLQDGGQIWAIKLKKSPQTVGITQPVPAPKIPTVEQNSIKKAAQAKVSKPQIETRPADEDKVVKLDIKSSQPKLSASEQLQRAVVLLKNRRWPEAEKLLQGLIDGPQDLSARTHLLGIFERKGDIDRYSAMVHESIQRYPQAAVFKTEYARLLFQQNNYRSVIEFLQGLNNADATQLALVAASYQRLDQHLQAVRYYKQSLDKDGQQTKNWIGLGISQEQTAQLEGALQSYRNAARLGNMNTRLQTFVEKRSRQIVQALN
jgi:tetratricopeptide (TPR) repeat protein